jgi:hypothetical protein
MGWFGADSVVFSPGVCRRSAGHVLPQLGRVAALCLCAVEGSLGAAGEAEWHDRVRASEFTAPPQCPLSLTLPSPLQYKPSADASGFMAHFDPDRVGVPRYQVRPPPRTPASGTELASPSVLLPYCALGCLQCVEIAVAKQERSELTRRRCETVAAYTLAIQTPDRGFGLEDVILYVQLAGYIIEDVTKVCFRQDVLNRDSQLTSFPSRRSTRSVGTRPWASGKSSTLWSSAPSFYRAP